MTTDEYTDREKNYVHNKHIATYSHTKFHVPSLKS